MKPLFAMVPLLTLDVVRQKLKDKGVAVEEVEGECPSLAVWTRESSRLLLTTRV